MIHIKLNDYFNKGPVKSTDSLFPYFENAIACRIKCRRLRREEFLDTLGVVQVGRGMDVKIVIDDLPKFERLESEIKMLETRAEDIDKMLLVLEGIVEKVGNIDISRPTPDGLRSGAGERRNRIFEIQRWLAETASKKMGFDTFAEPEAGPQNIAEVMKKDLDDAQQTIEQMEKEIGVLESLARECTQIMVDNGHLLVPAEEPVIEPEPKIWYWQKHEDGPKRDPSIWR